MTCAEILALFQAFETIVFDEFHLYNGVELAHALFLIFLAQRMGAFQRVVLLSATPNEEGQNLSGSTAHPACD